MRHSLVEGTGVHHDRVALKRKRETVKAARCRAIKILAINVIVRAMTGTLEAIAVITERNRTAKMDAFLVQRDPVRTIAILHKPFIIELAGEVSAAQKEFGT